MVVREWNLDVCNLVGPLAPKQRHLPPEIEAPGALSQFEEYIVLAICDFALDPMSEAIEPALRSKGLDVPTSLQGQVENCDKGTGTRKRKNKDIKQRVFRCYTS